jgi:hypothetical protein
MEVAEMRKYFVALTFQIAVSRAAKGISEVDIFAFLN